MAVKLFDETIDGLKRVLDLRLRRHEVIATNVANAETPGYKAKDLAFDRALADAFSEQPSSVAEAASAPVVEDHAAPMKPDGNSVDLDLQMMKMAANANDYQVAARILRGEFKHLRDAIDETK